MRENLLGIGKKYAQMLSVATHCRALHYPAAYRNARESARKTFYAVDRKKIRDRRCEYHMISDLPLIDNFSLILNRTHMALRLAEHDHLFSFFESLPDRTRKLFQLDARPALTDHFESIMAFRKFLKMEILSYSRRRKTRYTGVEQLKQLIMAHALFLPANNDILHSIRKSIKTNSRNALLQNALTELLFSRLPRLIEGLVDVDSRMIRRKFLSKLEELPLTAHQRITLLDYIRPVIPQSNIIAVLQNLRDVSTRLPFGDATGEKLHDYLSSLIEVVTRIHEIYRELYLNPELSRIRALYRPQRCLLRQTSYWETIVKTYTHVIDLEFFPAKDWMDLHKGQISSDCTGFGLGKQHLLTPNYFTIRIFENSLWTGNMYMLDFTAEYGCILVDRIQIPRELRVEFVQFFDCLREVLVELFEDADYRYILMPLRISNHEHIQKTYNKYRQKLPEMKMKIRFSGRRYFESLKRSGKYHILYAREDIAGMPLSTNHGDSGNNAHPEQYVLDLNRN
jgi:hypothetical protein